MSSTGKCLRVIVLGGSNTGGAGVFYRASLHARARNDADVLNRLHRCGDPRFNFTFPFELENLLNAHFPCKAETPPPGTTRPTAEKPAHRWIDRSPPAATNTSTAAAAAPGRPTTPPPPPPHEPVLSTAQLRGRHIVENHGMSGMGSMFWMQEANRWRNEASHSGSPFSADIVDLARVPAAPAPNPFAVPKPEFSAPFNPSLHACTARVWTRSGIGSARCCCGRPIIINHVLCPVSAGDCRVFYERRRLQQG